MLCIFCNDFVTYSEDIIQKNGSRSINITRRMIATKVHREKNKYSFTQRTSYFRCQRHLYNKSKTVNSSTCIWTESQVTLGTKPTSLGYMKSLKKLPVFLSVPVKEKLSGDIVFLELKNNEIYVCDLSRR